MTLFKINFAVIIQYSYFVGCMQLSFIETVQAQNPINYLAADSLFTNFAKSTDFTPDSVPLLSKSPAAFKVYSKTLEKKQLLILDTFIRKNLLDSLVIRQLRAKITYQNLTFMLQHPLVNGFFEVQQNEEASEQSKAFYRISYNEYGSFLDSVDISNESYLVVPEYITFLDTYTDYQEMRFHVFNSENKCTKFDRYWLVRLLFTGKVRSFMASKVVRNLQQETNSSKELEQILKDFTQKYSH